MILAESYRSSTVHQPNIQPFQSRFSPPMPQTDPNAMNAVFWSDVSLWLTYLWIYFPLIILFAFCMLIAHGLIPSGVRTGTYPAMFSRLRIPLTVIGVGALAGAVVMLILTITQTPVTLLNVWDRLFV